MPRSEKIEFPGSDGQMLAARLDVPDGEAPKAYALFAHCFTCSKDVFAAARIAAALSEHGIAVMRFDFTGLGASEGDFANTNFSSNVGDLVAAYDYMDKNLKAPAIVVGHSLGGAAVLAAAPKMPKADAICTIGAPADPAHVAHHFQSARAEIEEKGEAVVKLVGRPFRIKKQFLDDIEAAKLESTIASMDKALLVFHSPIDQMVGIENAQAIYRAAKHPKSFVSLDDADHLLSRKSDAVYVASVIAAWVIRYVDFQESAKAPSKQVKDGTVVVAENGQGKYSQNISIGGRHTLPADEPTSVGGDDTGPNPYELLLSSLGACTSMTMRMYAEHKGISVDRFLVTLSHEKLHADDCEDCEGKSDKVDVITREIDIQGDVSDEVRAKLLAIADKCPVHRTLHGEIKVRTALVESD